MLRRLKQKHQIISGILKKRRKCHSQSSSLMAYYKMEVYFYSCFDVLKSWLQIEGVKTLVCDFRSTSLRLRRETPVSTGRVTHHYAKSYIVSTFIQLLKYSHKHLPLFSDGACYQSSSTDTVQRVHVLLIHPSHINVY